MEPTATCGTGSRAVTLDWVLGAVEARGHLTLLHYVLDEDLTPLTLLSRRELLRLMGVCDGLKPLGGEVAARSAALLVDYLLGGVTLSELRSKDSYVAHLWEKTMLPWR